MIEDCAVRARARGVELLAQLRVRIAKHWRVAQSFRVILIVPNTGSPIFGCPSPACNQSIRASIGGFH